MAHAPRVVLIAGGAAEASMTSGEVVPKQVAGGLNAKGNLQGPILDVEERRELLMRKRPGIRIVSFNSPGSSTRISDVRAAIREAIDDKSTSEVQIFYSGHGQVLTGSWCFENSSGETTEFITLDEILGMWGNPTGRQLNIWADSCFSGAWVEALEMKNIPSVSMMASSGPREVSWDSPTGGVFTKRFDDCKMVWQTANDWQDPSISVFRYEPLDDPDVKSTQTPCMYLHHSQR